MKMQFPASLEIFASKKELSEFLLDGTSLQKNSSIPWRRRTSCDRSFTNFLEIPNDKIFEIVLKMNNSYIHHCVKKLLYMILIRYRVSEANLRFWKIIDKSEKRWKFLAKFSQKSVHKALYLTMSPHAFFIRKCNDARKTSESVTDSKELRI